MPLVISLRSHTREARFVSGNNPRVIDGAAEIRFGAAPKVDLDGRNSLATNRGSADVADGSRLCENTAFEVARRISVSVSSLWKADCTGDFS